MTEKQKGIEEEDELDKELDVEVDTDNGKSKDLDVPVEMELVVVAWDNYKKHMSDKDADWQTGDYFGIVKDIDDAINDLIEFHEGQNDTEEEEVVDGAIDKVEWEICAGCGGYVEDVVAVWINPDTLMECSSKDPNAAAYHYGCAPDGIKGKVDAVDPRERVDEQLDLIDTY